MAYHSQSMLPVAAAWFTMTGRREVGVLSRAGIRLHAVIQEPGSFLLGVPPFTTRPPGSCHRGERVVCGWGVHRLYSCPLGQSLSCLNPSAASEEIVRWWTQKQLSWVWRGHRVVCGHASSKKSGYCLTLGVLHSSYCTCAGKCSWNSCHFQGNVSSVYDWCWVVCVSKRQLLLPFNCESQVVWRHQYQLTAVWLAPQFVKGCLFASAVI